MEKYKENMGWLRPEKWADENMVADICRLAEMVRKDADVFVLVGVGGSNQAARSVIEALKPDGGPEILYAGNNLSAKAMEKVLKQLSGKSVYINVIAKNFETLEPGVSFRILRSWMKEAYGEDYRKRIIATGTKNSALEKLCREQGYYFLEFPDDIGGRYSAITSVGLFPMAAAGIQIEELVQGAKDEAEMILHDKDQKHLAYQYADRRFWLYQQGYRIELLVFFEPDLQWFSKWWVQLFAESEGKQERGIYPVSFSGTEDLHATGQFVQEGTKLIAETFLEIEESAASVLVRADGAEDGFSYLDGKDLAEINRIAENAVRKAHKTRNPCFTIRIPRLDAYWFGRLFYFFEYACFVSAEHLGVNPFDQPGVEAYKMLMFKALGREDEHEA